MTSEHDDGLTLFDPQLYIEELPTDKLPLQPVLDAWGSTPAVLARALGVHRRTVNRWLEEGVDFDTGDRLALFVERSPMELWRDQWGQLPDEDDDDDDDDESTP